MIAILSDFSDSEYLGVMKGVILSINKNAKIIDLYNKVNPQNIKEGAWILLNSFKYFPKNTIFLCVVDPGVGSSRQGIAVKTKNYYFVGPDNGLMYPSILEDGIKSAVKLPEKNASRTFHGRDVFAKAAAKSDKGMLLDKLGQKTEIKEKLSFYLKNRVGEIVRIDNFGNIITNLKSLNKNQYIIKIKNKKIKLPFYQTYAEAPENRLFLIKGSADTLEISLKNKKAADKIQASVGSKIEIK